MNISARTCVRIFALYSKVLLCLAKLSIFVSILYSTVNLLKDKHGANATINKWNSTKGKQLKEEKIMKHNKWTVYSQFYCGHIASYLEISHVLKEDDDHRQTYSSHNSDFCAKSYASASSNKNIHHLSGLNIEGRKGQPGPKVKLTTSFLYINS